MSNINPRNPDLIHKMSSDPAVSTLAREFFNKTIDYRYSYNFSWLGVAVIQYPQDLMALQELIWRIRPQVIIETGIAHGGSLIFYASLLELIGGNGKVIGIDVDIRPHNREIIEKHPLYKRIQLIEGSSIDGTTVNRVNKAAAGAQPALVILDSNHTCDHVLKELELYGPMVQAGSYLVVLDTVIEDIPASSISDRPWGPGNSPKTAVHRFLKDCDRFVIDQEIENALLLTAAPSGYLKCVKSAA